MKPSCRPNMAVLEASWGPKWSQVGPQDGANIGSNMEGDFFQKISFFQKDNHDFQNSGHRLWGAKIDENSMKNRCKNGSRIGVPFLIDFSSIWDRFGCQVAPKIAPKRIQKSIQNRSKINKIEIAKMYQNHNTYYSFGTSSPSR